MMQSDTSNEWRKEDFLISTDRSRLNLEFIHDFLSSTAYWAKGRSFDVVKRAIENSLNFGVFDGSKQIGFARVVTDFATFAWLADVFIIEEYRGRGLGVWLIEVITSHAQLQGFRRWILATRDAHDLYQRFGFSALADPQRYMERRSKIKVHAFD
jgi:GNAT superfamily N-acetyltransferase